MLGVPLFFLRHPIERIIPLTIFFFVGVGVFDCARTKPVKRFLLLLTAPPKFYRSFMAVYALGLQSNLDATREILQKFVICYFASEKPRMVTRGNDVLVFANDEWREARYNPKPQDLSVPWWMRQ